LLFDGAARRAMQASRPLQKSKGRAATTLVVSPRNRKKQKQQQQHPCGGGLCCFVSPLAPPRPCRGISSSISGTGAFGIGGGIGTMYFGDIGRSGFAVGCLPAPLRSGPAKKLAGLPFSPPNARGPVPV